MKDLGQTGRLPTMGRPDRSRWFRPCKFARCLALGFVVTVVAAWVVRGMYHASAIPASWTQGKVYYNADVARVVETQRGVGRSAYELSPLPEPFGEMYSDLKAMRAKGEAQRRDAHEQLEEDQGDPRYQLVDKLLRASLDTAAKADAQADAALAKLNQPLPAIPGWVARPREDRGVASTMSSAYGWPVPALAEDVRNPHTFSVDGRRLWIWTPGMPDAAPIRQLSPMNTPREFGFPLRPIWPGAAIDTAFFAILLWLPRCLVGFARRRTRRRHGRCLTCGYDTSSLPSDTPCPECGTV